MAECEIPNHKRAAIRRALLRWYRAEHRAMPWRAEAPALPNPYHVLLSEAMLQQTQVATVIDYFHRFVEAFPTVEDLAGADEQQVLKLWQGLGYYRRARNLHAAARMIVDEFDGVVPDHTDELLRLPGIGPYCAGAIGSIAFGQRAPLVDGNVIRVLTRLLAIDDPSDGPATVRRLWALADSLLPRGRTEAQRAALAVGELGGDDFPRGPGDFNQALMELGATVCTPRNADCGNCPLGRQCAAKLAGNPESYPVKKTKTVVKPVLHRIVAVQKGKQWLIAQRPESGLWSSMWQLPTLEEGAGVRRESVRGLKGFVRSEFNLEISKLRFALGFDHLTSHRKIRFELFVAECEGGRLKSGSGQWRGLGDLEDLPFPNPQRHALKHLGEAEK